MINSLGEAAVTLMDPLLLGVMAGAIIIGLVIGILPGISGMLGVALWLPFVFLFPTKELALAFLIGMHSVVYTGGAITSILIGVPGESITAATCLDGFPMTQKGEGGRALGAGISASMFGGIVSVLLGLATIPLLLPIILACKSVEMLCMVVLGLSCLASLTGGSAIKGTIAGCLGMAVALIGFQGATGVYRFTFNSIFLYEGLKVVVVAMGMFGLPEMIDMIVKGQETIAQTIKRPKLVQVLQGVGEVFRHRWLSFRCMIIGYIIGILPGIGGSTSSWMSYAQAKQTSKHPELFGTGIVEGVIAPQAGLNSKDAGDWLCTMAFGIPGSGVMALIMASFFALGITPGPSMMVEHLPLALTVLLAIGVSNVVAGIICLGTAPYLARVSYVHIDFLFPTIIALLIAAAYVSEGLMANLIVVIIFGGLGFMMKKFDYSRPAFLLGFILGHLFEYYLIHSMKFQGPLFFVSSPLAIALLALSIFVFALPALRSGRKGAKKRVELKGSPFFLIFLLLLMSYVFAKSLTFGRWEANSVFLSTSGIILILGAIQVRQELRARRTQAALQAGAQVGINVEWRRFGQAMGWIVGFSVTAYLVGFLIGIPFFLFSYLRKCGRGWVTAIICAVTTIAFIYGMFEVAFKTQLYRGLIWELSF